MIPELNDWGTHQFQMLLSLNEDSVGINASIFISGKATSINMPEPASAVIMPLLLYGAISRRLCRDNRIVYSVPRVARE